MLTDITLFALAVQAERARTAERLRLEHEARATSALDAGGRRPWFPAPDWLKRARFVLRAAH
ncbi:MAG TPA: hypothetical protein VLA89_06790 [Gemmatimonadales bacterium]|nr:hypothetical protein [Gemmatimonadales bacterium]